MQSHHYFKIKTVNLDPDIFILQKENTKKSPISLIRSLTQRKGSQSCKKRVTSGERYIKPCVRQENQQINQSDIAQPTHTQVLFQGFERNILKKHNKTNPSNPNQNTSRQSRKHFKRYQQTNSHAFQLKEEDPEIQIQLQSKPNNEKEKKDEKIKEMQEFYRNEQRIKVNPYTKTQYIYMRNHQIDQLMQLKRSGKVREVSSITKSYKVTTINLTPQASRRSHSFRLSIPMPTSPSKNRYSPYSLSPYKKQSQIKPWQSAAEQSKQYLQ